MMAGVVVIDANMLALLIVGAASREYIGIHKNTKDDFDQDDFDLLNLLIKDFSEIVLVAHVVAEASNLIRQIGEPKCAHIQHVFANFISQNYEMPVASIVGIDRSESVDLGVTDAILLHLCSFSIGNHAPTLLTIDGALTRRALALDLSVINYRWAFQT